MFPFSSSLQYSMLGVGRWMFDLSRHSRQATPDVHLPSSNSDTARRMSAETTTPNVNPRGLVPFPWVSRWRRTFGAKLKNSKVVIRMESVREGADPFPRGRFPLFPVLSPTAGCCHPLWQCGVRNRVISPVPLVRKRVRWFGLGHAPRGSWVWQDPARRSPCSRQDPGGHDHGLRRPAQAACPFPATLR
jgi:hypothetical protein